MSSVSHLTETPLQAEDVVAQLAKAVVVLDFDHRVLFWSAGATRLYGLEAQQMLGRPLAEAYRYEFLNGEDPVAATQRVLDQGCWIGITRHHVHDGRTLMVESEVKPFLDADGQTIGFLASLREVTERRRHELEQIKQAQRSDALEAALRRSQTQFQTLFESDMMGIGIPDRFGAFREGNNELLRQTGYTRDELNAGLVRWDTMTPPEYAELDMEHIAEAATRGWCTPYEKEYIRKDGTRYPILCGFALLEGSQDEYVGFVMDLTKQKMMEAALRRSEKLATAGRLAASIAHEINNPLASVTNTLFLALSDPTLSDVTRNYLNVADQELARVAHIATQTLRFHKQARAAEVCDLSELMESVCGLFAHRLKSRGIHITRELQPNSKVLCFSDEVRQVFANLISNAMDATNEGGTLRLRVRPGRRWDTTLIPGVRVTVADTGHGIPPAMREKIFDAFVSTKDDTGTGLGLWVVEEIVRKHKGSIRLRTRVGKTSHGTIFSLFLPLSGVPPTATPLP